MRSINLLVFFGILLASVPSYAGLSDPNELVEDSKIDPALIRSTETWSTVTDTVKGWWDKGVEAVTGTKSAAQKEATRPRTETTKIAPEVETDTTTGQVDANQGDGTETSAETATQGDSTAPETTAAPVPVVDLGVPPVDQGTTSSELKEAKRLLKDQSATRTSKPGRKHGTNLKVSTTGVPVFPLEIKQTVKLKNGKTKVVMAPLKKIPRLDVGEEPTLSAEDFILKDYKFPLRDVGDIKSLPSPELVKDSIVKALTTRQVLPAKPAIDMDKKSFGVAQIVTKDTITKSLPRVNESKPVAEKPVAAYSENQLKMLTASILYAKGDRCHILLGMLEDVAKDSKDTKLQTEANFHLGACAQKLKMYSLAFERLSTIIRSENADFAGEAIELLAQNLLPEYELPFSKLIRDFKAQKLISQKIRDEVHFLTAKGAFKESNYLAAKTYAEKVTESSPRFGQAQYLIGISWYSLGNLSKAVAKLEGLRTWLAALKNPDKNLNSLSAINLARMKFTEGRFKEALPLYMAIDKDHPFWVQGLVEQGWTQLALEDYSGAIGNMYSLHSPYFKAVYKPESFVVRTIGYLNICQYGDAYRTLSWLEHDYRPWAASIEKYVSTKKLASDYYETAKGYLKGKSDEDADGLPYQVVREMARQREFLNYQLALNEKADETGRYEAVDKKLADEQASIKTRIAKATLRFKDLKAKLKQAEKDRSLLTQADQWRNQIKMERELVIGLRYQAQVLQASRKSYAQLLTKISTRLEKEKYVLREGAGRDLVTTLLRMKGDINTILENNEFLRYETFAGSGENIRYQVAGGETAEANRLPASVKPTKMLNWSFDGEYWEDEIGSYRSSLNDNCPKMGKMSDYFKDQGNVSSDPKGQAAIDKGDR